MASNHDTSLSEEALSDCLAAVARHSRDGRLWEPVPRDEEVEAMSAHSAPPAKQSQRQLAETKVDDTFSVLYNPYTRAVQETPPLITAIKELISIAPFAMIDESLAKVAGSRPLYYSPGLQLIRIADDKSKETMQKIFWMVMHRPLVADMVTIHVLSSFSGILSPFRHKTSLGREHVPDMYLAGNSTDGAKQTCFVHVLRKAGLVPNCDIRICGGTK